MEVRLSSPVRLLFLLLPGYHVTADKVSQNFFETIIKLESFK